MNAVTKEGPQRRCTDSSNDVQNSAAEAAEHWGLALRLFRTPAGDAIQLRDGTLNMPLGVTSPVERGDTWQDAFSGLEKDGIISISAGGRIVKNVNGFGPLTLPKFLGPLSLLEMRYGDGRPTVEESAQLARAGGLTTGDIAFLLGVSQHTVIRSFDSGEFKEFGGSVVPRNRSRRVRPEGLVAWARAQTEGAALLPKEFVALVDAVESQRREPSSESSSSAALAASKPSYARLAYKDALSTGEVASLLAVSQQTVIRVFDRGELTPFGAYRVPRSKFRRIPPRALVLWCEAQLAANPLAPRLPEEFTQGVKSRS